MIEQEKPTTVDCNDNILRENTGTVSKNLRSMPIGEEHAMAISFADVANIRGLITKIHSANTKGVNAGYRFKTEKTATGIRVWRIQ